MGHLAPENWPPAILCSDQINRPWITVKGYNGRSLGRVFDRSDQAYAIAMGQSPLEADHPRFRPIGDRANMFADEILLCCIVIDCPLISA